MYWPLADTRIAPAKRIVAVIGRCRRERDLARGLVDHVVVQVVRSCTVADVK